MKGIFVALTAMAIFNTTQACDVCGCGVGNFNPYMFPHLVQKYVSIGYTYRYYKTNAHDDMGNAMLDKEYYNTLSLAGQFTIKNRIQLMGYLPFQINTQQGPEGNKSLNRLGDAIVMADYKIYDQSSGHNKLRQTISAGAGIKLPTGNYHFEEGSESEVDNPNFQSGTGSTDFLLNGYYAIRYKKFAMSTGVTYKINTANKEDYRFGNRLLAVAQIKYVKDAGNISLIPNVGVQIEKMDRDKQSKIAIDHTGGYNTQATFGLDVNNRKIAAGIFYNKPITQNLASGDIYAMPGINFHISYIL
jgi:hypothetical protein